MQTSTQVLVVGAGPAGAAAAYWCAREGGEVLVLDGSEFPRDKTCGDGLTPRAVAELNHVLPNGWCTVKNAGLRTDGFGQRLYLPWPGGNLPDHGSAIARSELDNQVLQAAISAGASLQTGTRAVGAGFDSRGHVNEVKLNNGDTIRCERLVVADGAKSQLGRELGREWHKDTVYGVAARGYVRSPRSNDPWISSHLELRARTGELLNGYGWVFPLGDGTLNIGVGTLASEKRPANVNLKKLLDRYAGEQRGEWELKDEVGQVRSAVLPMGGAVSGVSGPNWVLVGDAAGCVNPLNGEGIDYGLETGRLAGWLASEGAPRWGEAWPVILKQKYGPAFSIARRLSAVITVPGALSTLGPVGMRSRTLMQVALRLMGNLVTEEDTDLVARAWREAGKGSMRADERAPFS